MSFSRQRAQGPTRQAASAWTPLATPPALLSTSRRTSELVATIAIFHSGNRPLAGFLNTATTTIARRNGLILLFLITPRAALSRFPPCEVFFLSALLTARRASCLPQRATAPSPQPRSLSICVQAGKRRQNPGDKDVNRQQQPPQWEAQQTPTTSTAFLRRATKQPRKMAPQKSRAGMYVATAVAVLLALAASAAATSVRDLCYEVSWDLAREEGPLRRLVRPVTEIPAGHVLTQRVCGTQRSAGTSEEGQMHARTQAFQQTMCAHTHSNLTLPTQPACTCHQAMSSPQRACGPTLATVSSEVTATPSLAARSSTPYNFRHVE